MISAADIVDLASIPGFLLDFVKVIGENCVARSACVGDQARFMASTSNNETCEEDSEGEED